METKIKYNINHLVAYLLISSHPNLINQTNYKIIIYQYVTIMLNVTAYDLQIYC
jgi:hypothetical protein